MSAAVDGAARGVLLGVAWGAVFDVAPLGFGTNPASQLDASLSDIGKSSSSGAPRPPVAVQRSAFAVVKSMGRSSLGFAGFLGVYNGVTCSFEAMRGGQKDMINSFAGGFAAGACAGLSSRNSRTIMISAMGTGCITAGVTLLTGAHGFQGGNSS